MSAAVLPDAALVIAAAMRCRWCVDVGVVSVRDEATSTVTRLTLRPTLPQHERYAMADELRACLEGKRAEGGGGSALSGSDASDDEEDAALADGHESAHGRVGLSNMGNTCVRRCGAVVLWRRASDGCPCGAYLWRAIAHNGCWSASRCAPPPRPSAAAL